MIIPDAMKDQITDIKNIEFLDDTSLNKIMASSRTICNYDYMEITILKKSQCQTKTTINTNDLQNCFANCLNNILINNKHIYFFKKCQSIPDMFLKIVTHNDIPIRYSQAYSIIVWKSDDPNIILDGNEKDVIKCDIRLLNQTTTNIIRDICMTRLIKPGIVKKINKTILRGILINGKSRIDGMRLSDAICSLCAIRPINKQIIDCSKLIRSPSNIKKIFNDALNDYKTYGDNSLIHCVIFDQIDLISGHNHIIKHLITIFNDTNYDNVLIIGLTHVPIYVDDRLEGPGRLEIQFDIGEVDSDGMHEINVSNLRGPKTKETDDQIYDSSDDEYDDEYDDESNTMVSMKDFNSEIAKLKSENDQLKEKINNMEHIIETNKKNSVDLFKHIALIMEKLTDK
jgi:hypothetical protein